MANDLDKNYLDVIKCEMTNDVLVTKSQIENFNTKSQLIVNEAQEALFYKDGHALDLFPAGRHSLTTDNLPFLKKLFGAIFGGKNAFTCEVFFINKVSVLDVLWGTDSAITLTDPKYKLLVNVRANGQTGIKVVDSRRFVLKVVGQLREFTVESVRRSVKALMMTSIKEIIASTIVDKGVSVLEITTMLSELSAAMQVKLNSYLEDLGLMAEHFYINGIYADEQDLRKLKEVREHQLEFETQIMLETEKIRRFSEAKAYAREVEGYSYQEQRQFDVLQAAAENNGAAGGMVGAGMGLGMGLGVMDQTRKMANNNMGGTPGVEAPTAPTPAATRICPGCQTEIPKQTKFCPECGMQLPPENKFCPECGNKLSPGAKFCPECGTKV